MIKRSTNVFEVTVTRRARRDRRTDRKCLSERYICKLAVSMLKIPEDTKGLGKSKDVSQGPYSFYDGEHRSITADGPL